MLRQLATIIGVAMLVALPASAEENTITLAINKAHLIQLDTDANVVLIDGDTLTKLMVDHNVGVSTVDRYEIKKVDTDFFSEE